MNNNTHRKRNSNDDFLKPNLISNTLVLVPVVYGPRTATPQGNAVRAAIAELPETRGAGKFIPHYPDQKKLLSVIKSSSAQIELRDPNYDNDDDRSPPPPRSDTPSPSQLSEGAAEPAASSASEEQPQQPIARSPQASSLFSIPELQDDDRSKHVDPNADPNAPFPLVGDREPPLRR